jgi:DNA-binding protein H-NS
MRKPRDFDSELKAINERAKLLQERKLRQRGELVAATGADAMPIEIVAGALLAACDATADEKEAWRRRGAAFFQRSRKGAGAAAAQSAAGEPTERGGSVPADAQQNML